MYKCRVFEQLNTDSQSANKSFLIARLKYNTFIKFYYGYSEQYPIFEF